MERKISSSFTEFYKVYSILCVVVFAGLFGLGFFSYLEFPASLFIFLAFAVNLFLVYDFWRMKDVEITDSGLIITERFFFTQKSIFVPFDKIEKVGNRLWWLGNKRRATIKFTEPCEFGDEICFIAKGFSRMAQREIIEEINRTVIRSRTEERLKAAFHELNN
jgi:hypothetical protein